MTSAPPEASPPPATLPRDEPIPASLVIDLTPPNPGPAWFISGLEDVMGNEFSRFHAIARAKKIDPSRCPSRDARCLVEQYRAEGVDVLVLGHLESSKFLKYAVYETWIGERAFEGKIQISGIDASTLAREIGEIVRPIVQRGGLLEQRPAKAESAAPKLIASAPTATRRGDLLPTLLAGAIVLVAFPVFLALLLVGGGELHRRETPASWKWSALLVVLLSAVLTAEGLLDLSAIFARAAVRAPPLAGLAPPIGAGILWGVFGLAIGRWVFAPLQGLERLREDSLWPVMRSWLVLALLRAVAVVALYLPIFAVTWWACLDAAMTERATLAFAIPAAGLVAHFALLALVDNLAVYLDVKLTSFPPTPRNPWHVTIERYFRGYLVRNVVDIEEATLARTLFLPSVRADVVCYGGGFARPRIAVGQKPLEAALGELPDEEELSDRTVNPEELPAGILVPSRSAEDDLAQLARAEKARHTLATTPARLRGYMPRLLGENATLLGWLLPQSAAHAARPTDSLPLISETEEDFGVVKRLLSEHYSAYLGNLNDDEVDDTDPTQKDFLFGALLREMGVILRRDVLFATIALSFVVAAQGSFVARVLALPIALYERFLSLPAARVADAYAALNSGLHPLIQYLCFARGAPGISEELLTARANVPRLIQASREMVAAVESAEPTAEERNAFRATPRDRVAWLTKIFHAPFVAERIRWGRVVSAIAVVAALTVVVLRSVEEAVAYHPRYVERIEQMKSQAAPPREGK